MGGREHENRKRKASAKSCQSLDTWVSKVPHQHKETIRRGTRERVKSSTFWKSIGIPNHQNRRFRVVKRENTFYVSTGLLSSFPDVDIL